jgi:hypothetical protein
MSQNSLAKIYKEIEKKSPNKYASIKGKVSANLRAKTPIRNEPNLVPKQITSSKEKRVKRER